jgi:hypothetical protein
MATRTRKTAKKTAKRPRSRSRAKSPPKKLLDQPLTGREFGAFLNSQMPAIIDEQLGPIRDRLYVVESRLNTIPRTGIPEDAKDAAIRSLENARADHAERKDAEYEIVDEPPSIVELNKHLDHNNELAGEVVELLHDIADVLGVPLIPYDRGPVSDSGPGALRMIRFYADHTGNQIRQMEYLAVAIRRTLAGDGGLAGRPDASR